MVVDRGVRLVESGDLGPGRAGEDAPVGEDLTLAVLDGYDFDESHVAAWRQRAPFVALIADHGADHGADAVVDHSLSAREDRYPGAALRLLGAAHALLREEFRDPPGTREPSDVPVVLVSLGGSATESLVPRLLEGLEAADRRLLARLVAGPHDELGSLAGDGPLTRGSATVIRVPPGPTLRPELERADLALLAAGGVRFEAARLGVPMLLVVLADNQVEDARAFAEAGAARRLGWWRDATPESMGAALREMLDDTEARRAMGARGQALVDGRGAERAARALLRAASGRSS
jgi:spore coat polysaccharide biosynthesis predicted glycosyltransferase SpsG